MPIDTHLDSVPNGMLGGPFVLGPRADGGNGVTIGRLAGVLTEETGLLSTLRAPAEIPIDPTDLEAFLAAGDFAQGHQGQLARDLQVARVGGLELGAVEPLHHQGQRDPDDRDRHGHLGQCEPAIAGGATGVERA